MKCLGIWIQPRVWKICKSLTLVVIVGGNLTWITYPSTPLQDLAISPSPSPCPWTKPHCRAEALFRSKNWALKHTTVPAPIGSPCDYAVQCSSSLVLRCITREMILISWIKHVTNGQLDFTIATVGNCETRFSLMPLTTLKCLHTELTFQKYRKAIIVEWNWTRTAYRDVKAIFRLSETLVYTQLASISWGV